MVKPPQNKTIQRIKLVDSHKKNLDSLKNKMKNSSNQLNLVTKFFEKMVDEMSQCNLDDFFAKQQVIDKNMSSFGQLVDSFLNDLSSLKTKDETMVKYIETVKNEVSPAILESKLNGLSLEDMVIDAKNFVPVFPQVQTKASLDVTISHINSPSDFYVQPYKGGPEFIIETQVAQQKLIDRGITSLPNISPGMFCVARFSEDYYWYRTKVVDVEGDKIKVYYIDFGNYEVVDSSRIMPMSKELADAKVLSVGCSLAAYKPQNGWPEGAIKVFKEKVSQTPFMCSFNDEAMKYCEAGEFPFYSVEVTLKEGSILDSLRKFLS